MIKGFNVLAGVFCCAVLLFFAGCPSDKGNHFVFGPPRPEEVAISFKEFNTKKPGPGPKTVDTMSKRELLHYVKNLHDGSGDKDAAGASGVAQQSSEQAAKAEQGKTVSFKIQNASGKTIYATCFVFLQRQPYASWRWDKTDIYKLEPDDMATVTIDSVHSREALENCYGYLAIFPTAKQAAIATYELTDDRDMLDLDKIYKLRDKTVNIEVKSYGSTTTLFDYQLSGEQIEQLGYQPELDFFVENATGKTLLVTAFVYEQQDDTNESPVWHYTKTPVQRLESGEIGLIDVSSSKDKYETLYTRGVLGVFEESETKQAEVSTFQLLPEAKTLKLNRLAELSGKKVVLNVEKYGIEGDFIDYTIKTKPRRAPWETVDNK